MMLPKFQTIYNVTLQEQKVLCVTGTTEDLNEAYVTVSTSEILYAYYH